MDRWIRTLHVAAFLSTVAAMQTAAAEIPVGTAKVDVTPTRPVVLTGYGHRVGEYTAVDTPLWQQNGAIGSAPPQSLPADLVGPSVAPILVEGARSSPCGPARSARSPLPVSL